MIDKDAFGDVDEAIDRAVRDMTRVSTSDRDEADAVARVMARLREADARRGDVRGRGMLSPRVAWAGAAALMLMAIVATGYVLRSPVPDPRAPRIAARAAAAPSSPATPALPTTPTLPAPALRAPSAVREIPTRAARAASTLHAATAARHARDMRDARDAQPAPPLESDIEIASITPAPLARAPAIYVEPLITSSLQVDEIPVASIEMPPVSPERKE